MYVRTHYRRVYDRRWFGEEEEPLAEEGEVRRSQTRRYMRSAAGRHSHLARVDG